MELQVFIRGIKKSNIFKILIFFKGRERSFMILIKEDT